MPKTITINDVQATDLNIKVEVNSTISVVGGPPDVQFWEIVETLARMLANVARQVGGVVMASSGEREEAVGSK
jgi:hypothetical protein